MKFALLGCDPDTLGLALEIARRPQHALVWAHDVADREPMLRAAAPGLVVAEHWESLLSGAIAEVVIVSRASDEEVRAEQLRKLAQVGAVMIVSHPAVESMLVYYELDMIRQEGQARLLPYVSERWHPGWRRLKELIGEGGAGVLGQLEQIVIEHISPSRGRSDIYHALVRDMEMVRPLCGVLNKVSAMTSSGVRTSAEAINYGTLSVQMSGTANLLVRWSVTVAADAPGGRFTLIGTRGKATLSASESGRWRLDGQGDVPTLGEDFEQLDLAAMALSELSPALDRSGPSSKIVADDTVVRWPDWLDACRTMELADAAQHSLERGRTIELHYEAPTEHTTFKGIMSAAGCLLLVIGLLVLVVATTAVNAGVPLADYWPHLLLGVLVVFLLLQLLKLVFPTKADE
jgi:predicted dehydrogenase